MTTNQVNGNPESYGELQSFMTKWVRPRQIEFGLFVISSMNATQDVGLKFLSIRPYSEATVFVNQKVNQYAHLKYLVAPSSQVRQMSWKLWL